MVVGSVFRTIGIYRVHLNFQGKSLEETRKNIDLYEAAKERGRSSTLQEQLDRLTKKHK